jgi:hypothetical protein
MKTGNSGIVLLYNCSGPEFSKLRQIFAMLRLRMHPITPDRYHIPLKDLALGRGEASAEAGEAIPERMLVFCAMNGAFLNQVLEVIRVAQLPPIPLKAVLTTNNQDWDSHKLYEELSKEREAIQAAKNQAKEIKQEGEAKEQAADKSQPDGQAQEQTADEPQQETSKEPQPEASLPQE